MRFFYGPQIIIPSPSGNPANGNSLAGNITSQPTIVQSMYAMSFGLVWTGTSPVGAVSVEGSNDFQLNAAGGVETAGNWTTLVLNYNGAAVSSVPITGNSGHGLIDIVSTGIYAVRLVYTRTSGTGSMIVTLNAKDT